ncbi:hypothetical protein GF371_05480 [Candidatus Woesearchaeota archaeon]|nr:hypothetical protein [Candidatus Woesearchaeota archaeon]
MEKELITGKLKKIDSSVSSIEEKYKECKNALDKLKTSSKLDLSQGKTSLDILSGRIKETQEMIEEFKTNLKEAIKLLQQMAATTELSQVQRKVDKWQPENLLTMEMLESMLEEL